MSRSGKAKILHSGFSTSNSYAYTAKRDTLNFNKTAILIEHLGGGSGIGFIVRGFPVAGFNKSLTLTSGHILGSGDFAYITLSDPYEQIDVGLISVQTDVSGSATVYATGKRR